MDITEKMSIIPRQEQPKPRPFPKAVIGNESIINSTQYEGIYFLHVIYQSLPDV